MANTRQTIDAHVGRQLRQIRLLRGFSQTELGNMLSRPVSFQQIQKYESGVNGLSANKMWELSRALRISPLYFFDGLTDAPHPMPAPSIKTLKTAEALLALPPSVSAALMGVIHLSALTRE